MSSFGTVQGGKPSIRSADSELASRSTYGQGSESEVRNTYTRNDTYSRYEDSTFTFRRTISSVGHVLGVPVDQQEEWTNKVIDTLEKVICETIPGDLHVWLNSYMFLRFFFFYYNILLLGWWS